MLALLPYLNSPFITLGLLVTVTLLLIANIFLILRLRTIFKGSNAESLLPLLNECTENIKFLQKQDEMLGDHAISLEERTSQAIRNVSTVRFKAFETGTSNQSFAIALVNEQGDGVVLSSLHHRDRVATYAKPVSKYTSDYDLSDEEKQVLKDSQTAHKKKA
jgi:spore germination protein GerM